MDEKKDKKLELPETQEIKFVPGTIEERLGMVWQMTVEEYSRTHPDFDPNEPLKRHITRVISKKG